jgi:Uma2 family endonuclease
MTVAERPPQRSAAPPDEAAPQPVRWTLDDFSRMTELGLFRGRRVHLLGGVLFEMGHQGPLHFAAIRLVELALAAAFGPAYWVRTQGPLLLNRDTDPEPDVSVVRGGPRDYPDHPTSALLVVEVSDSSLRHDRATKASLYASAGIADYWIVNLVDRCLEVRRGPVADPAAEGGHRYAQTVVFFPADSVSPLAAPQGRIAVADLLP